MSNESKSTVLADEELNSIIKRYADVFSEKSTGVIKSTSEIRQLCNLFANEIKSCVEKQITGENKPTDPNIISIPLYKKHWQKIQHAVLYTGGESMLIANAAKALMIPGMYEQCLHAQVQLNEIATIVEHHINKDKKPENATS